MSYTKTEGECVWQNPGANPFAVVNIIVSTYLESK